MNKFVFILYIKNIIKIHQYVKRYGVLKKVVEI